MFKFFKFLSTSKIIMAILFALITLSFVLWGMGDIFNIAGKGRGIATVNGKELSYPEFENRYKNYLRRYNIEQMPVEQQRALGIANRVASEMIGERIIESEIKNLGLQASDKAIATSIRNNPIFKDEATGKFNRLQYENICAQTAYQNQRTQNCWQKTLQTVN